MASFFASRFFRRAASTSLVLLPTAGAYTYYTKSERANKTSDLQSLSNPHTASSSPFTSANNVLSRVHAEAASQTKRPPKAGALRTDLPNIPAATVRTSDGKQSSQILVTFGDGVYDITEFAESHPGGNQILLAAGGPLEPFWSVYAQHSADWVYEILEELRVGNLVPDEEWKQKHSGKVNTTDGPYAKEPKRHPALIVQGATPFNAETPAQLLVTSQVTPNDLFYVRNHMPVPHVIADDYRLSVVSPDATELAKLSLNDLKTKFEKVTIPAVVQCAGNRRNGLNRVRKVKGGPWEIGAIGSAEWSGARLRDVIAYATAKSTSSKTAEHVWFEGLDEDPKTGVVYAASIPLDIVNRHGDVLLAYEMNGEPLPADHGFPVRALVPGVTGARSVKWLGRVVLSETESDSHWQRKDYRSFAPDVDWNNVDFSAAPSIQEMPVVSAICTHTIDDEDRTVSMQGYAWSGDGKGIVRVDVSVDGGKTWTAATLREKGERKRNQVYDWTLWSATVKMPASSEGLELVCKAIDSAYNSQPDGASNVWNLRGLLNNSWHRVAVSERSIEETE